MKNIKIVDYYSIRTFHEIINLSLLKISCLLYENVLYVSGKTSQDNIKQLISKEGLILNNIYYHSILICDKYTSWRSFLRELGGVFISLYQYLLVPKSTVLLYSYTSRLSLPMILGLNILFKKKVLFVFHGELETLVKKIPLYKPSWLYKKCLQLSLKCLLMKSPAYGLVLGASIKSNLLKIFPAINEHITFINHPYNINETGLQSVNVQGKRPLRLGTVGVMNKAKGLDSLILLSKKMNDYIQQGELEIYCVGTLQDMNIELTDTIYWLGNKNGLPRDEFESKICMLDYILFLYPTDSYKLTASGAILDAIKLKKPVIALHNDFIDTLMGDAPFGYLKNSVDEIEQVIRQILSGELNDDFEKEYKIVSQRINLEYNAALLKEQLEKIKFL